MSATNPVLLEPAYADADRTEDYTATMTIDGSGSISGWTLVGTLYDTTDTLISAGVTVTITDAAARTVTLVIAGKTLTEGQYAIRVWRTDTNSRTLVFWGTLNVYTPRATGRAPLLVTPTDWQNATGQTVTGAELVALSRWCMSVDAAIRKAIKPYVPNPTTFTDVILDAPPDENLILPAVPVRSIASIYLHPGANGDPSAFTSADLLTAYTDYFLQIDPIDNHSRSGIVRRRPGMAWGAEAYREIGRLGGTYQPNRGAIKVTFAAGPMVIPEDLIGAATLGVSYLMGKKKTAAFGENWGTAAAMGAPSILRVPDIADMLLRYQDFYIA